MSQIGNALRMYFLLQAKGKMKIKDLAELVETDERTIRRYRNDLEQAGIYILAETGKYGGYSILNNNYLLGLNLTEQEYMSLLLVESYMKDTKHIAFKDLSKIVEKVNVINKKRNSQIEGFSNHITKSTVSGVSFEIEMKRLMDIHSAVLIKNKVEIVYTSLSSGKATRIVRPYATLQYKGDMYLIAYCETRKRVLDFKMCRISEFKMLEESFEPDEEFDLEQCMKNCFGIYKGSEFNIKLRIRHPMSQIIKEKVWVENQRITENEDGSILYEACMRGLIEMKGWILSMGRSVVVIEPEELKEEIRMEIEGMRSLY